MRREPALLIGLVTRAGAAVVLGAVTVTAHMLGAITAIVLVACGSSSPPVQPIGNANTTPQPPVLALRMERTECLGDCPAYTVTIMSDGAVTWHGESSVAVKGDRTSHIARTDVDRVVAAFVRAKFFERDKPPKFVIEKINGRDVTVICTATDQPSTIVSIPHDGKLHRFEHEDGCELAQLVAAEKLVDTVVGTSQWIGPVAPR